MKKFSLSICLLLFVFIVGALCGCKQENDDYDIWEKFVASGTYKEYITDESYLSTLEYAIYDLNADGVPELLMDAGDPAPFFNTWLFALEEKNVVLVAEHYGYGQYRYATEQNLIIGTPEFRPFDGTGYYPFYKLDGTNYENSFSILQDEGVWYYDDKNERMEITEADSNTYFSDAITFEWVPIEN